ncbi:MAG: arabinosyltransferase domain-containing protein [Gordonia sp. (in: high G+C Gram-positive bacteria)]
MAVIAGLVAIVAAVLTPLLPVTVSTASITWPQGQRLTSSADVTAPLVAQMPETLDVSIPCGLLSGLPADTTTTVLATMPADAKQQRQSALIVTATATAVSVSVRGDTLVTASRADVRSDRCTRLHIWSSAAQTGGQFVGLGSIQIAADAHRPQVAGIFTDLSPDQVAGAKGLAVRIDVDDRFDSRPSVLKWFVMTLGVLAAGLAVAALAVLDQIHGYHRRIGRVRWLALIRPRATDIAVTAILLLWHFLGAGSADDGYILNMGRNAAHAGYLADYYRYYGIPEAPFDWYYDVLAHWSAVSAAGVWMRIPSLVVGLLSWFVLSRVLLPRLGRSVRTSQWAMVTGAAVFLVFWLPMASGLRSEGVVVLGSLLTWWGVEQAIATRRLLPAAGAAFAAALTLATAPTGVIAIALLVTGARPLLAILVRRRHESGLFALLAPILAAPAIVAIVVFRDQPLASVFEAIRIRYTVGPTLVWYQELLRYYFLFVNTRDGALTRRIPVLILVVSLLVVLAIMLRRKGIRGIDGGPVWRVAAAVLITVALLSLAPTKWTVQFGIFAGLGAALAGVAAVAISQVAARNTRNLSVLVAGLLVAAAVAAAGYNAWPWSYDFGIPFFDKAPVFAGFPASSILLGLAGVTLLVALWQHLRLDYVADTGLHHDAGKPPNRWRTAVAAAPIAIIAVVILVAELAVFAKAAVTRADTYSVLKNNVDSLHGGCGMADYVQVEVDANRGMLRPAGALSPSKALEGRSRGFSAQGVADDLYPKADSMKPGTQNTSADLSKTFVIYGAAPGTAGGTGPTGVNGSTAALPFGLDPATTPVMGSYGATDGQETLTTGWYELPARSASPLIVITAAGTIASTDPDGVRTYGQSLQVQFGVADGTTFTQVGHAVAPIDADHSANRPWRNLRIPMSWVPARATVMRIVAADNNLDPDQWLAITPPRAPQLQTLQKVVGATAPVLVDFTVGAQFPCQHPMAAADGINQIPQWRILPEPSIANAQSKTWMATVNGGLLTTADALTSPDTVATYLRNDWYRDWGSLQRLTPLVPDSSVAVVSAGRVSRWGASRPGAMQVVPQDE